MIERGGSLRRYGFACSTCRRRKIRCDGEKPVCQRCLRSNEVCCYKSDDASDPGSTAQLQKALSRIQELERGIQRLAVADDEERDKLLLELANDSSPDRFRVAHQSIDVDASTRVGPTPRIDNSPSAARAEQSEITIDEDGSVSFFILPSHPFQKT